MAGPRFKPRFDDRHDKLAFFLAFSIGAIGILVVRTLGSGRPLSLFDFLAVIISVGVIVAYTIYILISTDRSSISLDRAGDNAYYLGLLFTLISLVYSLWKVSEIALATGDGSGVVRSSDRVLSLLPDFGLALSSTIAGIFSRVFVQQFRNDPADIETQARQELGEAIRMLRASLLQSVSDMNSTSKAANVAMTEITVRTRKTIEETAEENIQLVSRLGRKVDEVANHFSDQVRSVSEGLKKLDDELGAAVRHMTEQSLELRFDGSSVQQGLGSVANELRNLRQQVEATKEGCQSFSGELSVLSGRIASVLPDDIVTQLQSVGGDVLERRERLVTQFIALENDITQVSQSLDGVGDRVSRAIAGVDQVGTANQNLTSQLKGAATQLADGQQKILSEFDSLEEEIRRTGHNIKQAPLTTSLIGSQKGVPGTIAAAPPASHSGPTSGSEQEKVEDEPDVNKPRRRWFGRLFP